MEEEAQAMEENGSAIFPEEFQVDDLLDLRGLPEPEKEGGEEDDDASKKPAFFALEKAAAFHVSEISLPEETEAANLEWLSRFVDDCHSEYLPAVATVAGKNTACFPAKQTSLWSTREAAGGLKKRTFFPAKAKRSNRRRRPCAFWSLSGSSPASSVFSSVSPSSSSSSSSSVFYEQHVSPEKTHVPKKRGRKPKISTDGVPAGERRCTHCGVQKTPQWRAGPHGPKTLCNACGVRFKSGRLLPEYRPACSPTFVTDIHSNSHRKVLEMRQKKEVRLISTAAPAVQSC